MHDLIYDLTREPKVVFWMFLVSRFSFCIASHMPPIHSYLVSRILFASKVMIMVHGSCLMAQQWWGPAQAPGPPIYIKAVKSKETNAFPSEVVWHYTGAFIWVPEFEDQGADSVFQCDGRDRDWEKDYLDLSPERPRRRMWQKTTVPKYEVRSGFWWGHLVGVK